MTTEDKQFAARALFDFMRAVPILLADDDDEREEIRFGFPKMTGLGTDGTCWTEVEFVENFVNVAVKAKNLLR